MNQQSGYAWNPIGGQAGAAASITLLDGAVEVSGLTGMTPASVLHFLTLTLAASPGNIGTFQIVGYISATAVLIANSAAVAPDVNNGAIHWTEDLPIFSFPPTVGVPDDGDAWDAAEFAPGYEGLLQRTAKLSYGALKLGVIQCIADQAIAVPPGCLFMIADMCGGGGGGEGGKRGETGATTAIYPQGGGGAGAPRVVTCFPTTPGELLNVFVGVAGAGGAAHGGAGADGTGSAIIGALLSDTRASANGGRGCGCGAENYSGNVIAALQVSVGGVYTDSFGAIAPGAIGTAGVAGARPCPISLGPVAGQVGGVLGAPSGSSFLANYHEAIPQRGGSVGIIFLETSPLHNYGYVSFGGGDPAQGTVGGNAGTHGTSGATHFGGCGGGGGGGGPYGDLGGNGGNGGAGNDSGAGGNATASTSPSFGAVGAGGGGGGCGGDGSASGGTPSAGSDGSPGVVNLYFLQATTIAASVTTP